MTSARKKAYNRWYYLKFCVACCDEFDRQEIAELEQKLGF